MNTKTILTLAVIAALPCAATAENISGAMYTAPSTADNNHPAPTTSANPLYGRVNIDTADQEHIATTAYVKGAYNSAIAAVNTSIGEAVSETLQVLEQQQVYQDRLTTSGGDEISTTVVGFMDNYLQDMAESSAEGDENGFGEAMDDMLNYAGDGALVTARAVAYSFDAMGTVFNNKIDTVQSSINNKRVEIYTTWNNDNAKQQVAFVTAQ